MLSTFNKEAYMYDLRFLVIQFSRTSLNMKYP